MLLKVVVALAILVVAAWGDDGWQEAYDVFQIESEAPAVTAFVDARGKDEDPFSLDAEFETVALRLTTEAQQEMERIESGLAAAKEQLKTGETFVKREDAKLKKDFEDAKTKEKDETKWKAMEEKSLAERAQLRQSNQLLRAKMQKLEGELSSKKWSRSISSILAHMGPLLKRYIQSQLYYIKWETNSKAIDDGVSAMKAAVAVANAEPHHKWANEAGGLAAIRKKMIKVVMPIVTLQTKVWLQDQANELWARSSIMVDKFKKDLGMGLANVELGVNLVNDLTIDFNTGMVGVVSVFWQAIKQVFKRLILPSIGEVYAQKACEFMAQTYIVSVESVPYDYLSLATVADTLTAVSKISFLTEEQKVKRKNKDENVYLFDKAVNYLVGIIKLESIKEEEKKQRVWTGKEAILQCEPQPMSPNDLKREKELLAAKHFGWKPNYGLMVTVKQGDVKRKEALAAWEKAGKPTLELVESWEHFGYSYKAYGKVHAVGKTLHMSKDGDAMRAEAIEKYEKAGRPSLDKIKCMEAFGWRVDYTALTSMHGGDSKRAESERQYNAAINLHKAEKKVGAFTWEDLQAAAVFGFKMTGDPFKDEKVREEALQKWRRMGSPTLADIAEATKSYNFKENYNSIGDKLTFGATGISDEEQDLRRMAALRNYREQSPVYKKLHEAELEARRNKLEGRPIRRAPGFQGRGSKVLIQTAVAVREKPSWWPFGDTDPEHPKDGDLRFEEIFQQLAAKRVDTYKELKAQQKQQETEVKAAKDIYFKRISDKKVSFSEALNAIKFDQAQAHKLKEDRTDAAAKQQSELREKEVALKEQHIKDGLSFKEDRDNAIDKYTKFRKELNQAWHAKTWLPYVLQVFEGPIQIAMRKIDWDILTQDVKDCGPIDYDALAKMEPDESYPKSKEDLRAFLRDEISRRIEKRFSVMFKLISSAAVMMINMAFLHATMPLTAALFLINPVLSVVVSIVITLIWLKVKEAVSKLLWTLFVNIRTQIVNSIVFPMTDRIFMKIKGDIATKDETIGRMKNVLKDLKVRKPQQDDGSDLLIASDDQAQKDTQEFIVNTENTNPEAKELQAMEEEPPVANALQMMAISKIKADMQVERRYSRMLEIEEKEENQEALQHLQIMLMQAY